MRSCLARLRDALCKPVDIAALVYFRILFGAILLWEVGRYFSHDWIYRYWIEPSFHFTYYGFSWVRPWPGVGMYVHFALLGVAAACVMVGCFYRVSAVIAFLGFAYVFLLDQSQYLNHFYFVGLLGLIMMCIPAHRAFSVDVWRKPHLRAHGVPAWTLWLLRAQVGIVYFYGGLAKMNGDWLRGWPLRIWLTDSTDLLLIGRYITEEASIYFFSYGGLLFDLSIVPLLLYRKTRLLAFALVLFFNITNAFLFQIGIFPWMMIAGSALYFDPSWPRRLFNLRPMAAVSMQSRHSRGVAAGLFVYMAFQLLFPLRHFLYPGPVGWTEEGHRFAWHMKLRDKEAEAEFFVTDTLQKKSWTVDLQEDLTERQSEKMSGRPDMILQFAHYLAKKFRAEGHSTIQVRAEVYAALNGRKPQLLIDPTANLADIPRNLAPASWIVPLSAPLPETPYVRSD